MPTSTPRLTDTLFAAAARTPDAVGLRVDDGACTYAELVDRVRGVAGGLTVAGVAAGDRVAMFLPNCAELVDLYFACWMLDAVAVPLNHRYLEREAQFVLEHSGAVALVTHPELVDRIDGIPYDEVGISARFIVGDARGDWRAFAELATAAPVDGSSRDEPVDALVLYTSGTTGNPKGVVWMQHGLHALGDSMRAEYGHDNETVQLLPTPISHVGGLSNVVAGVIGGSTTVLGASADPADVLPAIAAWGPSLMQLLPTGLDDFVEAGGHEHHDLSTLRAVLVGGDKVPLAVHRRFADLLGFDVTEGIGMTECSHYASNPPYGEKRLGSVGRAVAGHEVRVVDVRGDDVPVGKTGEIVVRSVAMFDHYWENDEATKEALRDGWLYTGDLGRFDADGWLWFMGRKKQIIIRAGSNIVPEEVEEVLYQHPAVALACVVGAPDERLGQRVEAYVELEHGESVSEDALRSFVGDRLAAYKVPERIVFLDALPRTGTGKLDRHRLEQQIATDLARAAET
jgi:acyl-CoA synthetase (AMP-forming)/AMP-acid ligase II